MTKILIDRFTVEQALEALEAFLSDELRPYEAAKTAAALKDALAEPVQEPVASIYITPNGAREFDDWRHDLPVGSNLLYTSPPQRKPLTEEEVRDLLEAEFLGGYGMRSWDDDLQVFRLAEQAHKIGGEP